MRHGTLTRLYERFRHVCVWRGLLLAGLALAMGAHALLSQSTPIIARRMGIYWVKDAPALAIGAAWLGIALALHMHYFWGRVEPVWRFSDLGVLAGLLAMAGGAVVAVGLALSHGM